MRAGRLSRGTRGGVAVALLTALAGTAAVADTRPPPTHPPAWSHRKPITLPPPASGAAGAFVEAILDAEVYRDAAPGLGDLRIRDGAGTEIAYVLRRHEKARRWTEREIPLLDLGQTASREVRFVLDLGAGAGIHSRVHVRTGAEARNFRLPVRIETSADGRQWQLVRLAGFIYVVEGDTRAADTSVGYPPSTARYVRVTITPPPGRPLPVTGAAIILETPAERNEEVVPATVVERGEDAQAPQIKVTRLILDLGGKRPVDRAELTIADRTFYRVVLVEASEDRQAWRWVGSGSVSGIDTPRLSDRQTGLRFPEATARYLRLTIQNLDDRPLEVSAVRLAAVRRGLVFRATPGLTYSLDYGSPGVAAPRYDLARAFPYLESEPIPVATLGPATPLPTRAVPKPWTEGRPLLIWVAMVGAALALGGLLLRLSRQIRPTPSDG